MDKTSKPYWMNVFDAIPSLLKEIKMEHIPVWLSIVITVITLSITATVFVASRPSRDEVAKIIDGKLEKLEMRFKNVEENLNEVKADIKTLLMRKKHK